MSWSKVSQDGNAGGAAEGRDCAATVVREVARPFGAQESEFDRRKRERHELLERWRRERIGIDLSDRLTREQVNDREFSRLVLSDAYK